MRSDANTRRSLGSRSLHPTSASQRLLFVDSAADPAADGFFLTVGAALVFAAGTAAEAEADAELELVATARDAVERFYPSGARSISANTLS